MRPREADLTSELVAVAEELATAVDALHFAPPVAYVYNPLRYASEVHTNYLRRYARRGVDALLLGMNPGPWGMAQSGVPFGEVSAVREWLGLGGGIGKPTREHPKRPILGLACPRSEVSGARLWGWAKARFSAPEAFFERFFVANYCPLVFMEESGRNRTPDKLPAAERDALTRACDRALLATVEALEPAAVIGIGAYAEAQASRTLAALGLPIGRVLHPSPASPAANRGWAEAAELDLARCGVPMPA